MAESIPTIVKSLEVVEVSLVDVPANPGATVALFKRRDPSDQPEDSQMTKTVDELAKGLTDAEKQIETLTKAAETNTAELKKRDDKITELTAELEKAKAGAGKPAEGEDIFKGMTPAAVELFKKMQADRAADAETLAKMRDKDETTEAIEKAKTEYPSVPTTTPAELGPIMKRVASNKTTAEDVAKLTQILKASSTLVEKALEGGESGAVVMKTGTDSVIAKVDIEAKELMKANSKLTIDDARHEVFKRSPELAQAYRDEMNAPKRN